MLSSKQGGGNGADTLLQDVLSCVLIQISTLTINLWLDTRRRKYLRCW